MCGGGRGDPTGNPRHTTIISGEEEGGGRRGRKETSSPSVSVCYACALSEAKEGGKGGLSVVWRWRKGRKEGGGLFLPLLLYGSGLPLLHPLPPPCVCKLVTGVSLPLLRFCVGRQKRNRRGRGRWGLSTGSVPRRFLPFLPSQRKAEKSRCGSNLQLPFFSGYTLYAPSSFSAARPPVVVGLEIPPSLSPSLSPPFAKRESGDERRRWWWRGGRGLAPQAARGTEGERERGHGRKGGKGGGDSTAAEGGGGGGGGACSRSFSSSLLAFADQLTAEEVRGGIEKWGGGRV